SAPGSPARATRSRCARVLSRSRRSAPARPRPSARSLPDPARRLALPGGVRRDPGRAGVDRDPPVASAPPRRPTIYHIRPVGTLYLVRHCRAAGQAPEAPLTAEGLAQAERLADVLAPLAPDRILSSPFRRAVQSVEPLAAR